jgi:hypothetical protein
MLLRRKIMKRIWALSAAVVLAGAAMAALGQTRGASGGNVAITVAKDTTAATAPVRADGTVDYVAAINAKYGAGVTPENNGVVMMLQVTGTGDTLIDPKMKGEFLRLLGAKEVPAEQDVWEEYQAYRKRVKGGNADASDQAYEEMMAATEGMWKEHEHPELAAYLKGKDKLLEKVKEAVGAPRWWMPSVASDGRTLESAFLLPPLGVQRDIATTLCAWAALKADAGDVNGALADIWVVRKMARQIGGGPTLSERLVGVVMEKFGTKTLAGIAATGQLTEAQCKAIAGALDAFGPMPEMVDAVDCCERWTILDLVETFATGQKDIIDKAVSMAGGNDSEHPGGTRLLPLEDVEQEDVDWNAVLRFCNKYFDDEVAAMQKPNMVEMRAAIAAFEDRVINMRFERGGRSSDPNERKRRPLEARAAYSERVAKLIASIFIPGLGKAAELERRAYEQLEMVRVIVAAAQMKAKTGNWPAKAEELVPGVLKELPKDAYSPSGAEPFKYVVRNGGVRVYSVGENGKDDGGVRDPASKKDDLGVGAK